MEVGRLRTSVSHLEAENKELLVANGNLEKEIVEREVQKKQVCLPLGIIRGCGGPGGKGSIASRLNGVSSGTYSPPLSWSPCSKEEAAGTVPPLIQRESHVTPLPFCPAPADSWVGASDGLVECHQGRPRPGSGGNHAGPREGGYLESEGR